jgi:cytoskeleton protein RodZ
MIRATQSSWVMVTDPAGKAVFDHVLKAGDVYKVPNKPGLSLTTGNGSGITLVLDGTELPKVANGAPHVVRNISLDPDRLTSDMSATDH